MNPVGSAKSVMGERLWILVPPSFVAVLSIGILAPPPVHCPLGHFAHVEGKPLFVGVFFFKLIQISQWISTFDMSRVEKEEKVSCSDSEPQQVVYFWVLFIARSCAQSCAYGNSCLVQ